MSNSHEVEVSGHLLVPASTTQEDVTNALIDWVESKGWSFGGRVGMVLAVEPEMEPALKDQPLRGNVSGRLLGVLRKNFLKEGTSPASLTLQDCIDSGLSMVGFMRCINAGKHTLNELEDYCDKCGVRLNCETV